MAEIESLCTAGLRQLRPQPPVNGEAMLAPDQSALAPLLYKLQRRSTFRATETDALLGLPIRRQALDASAYLVREGEVPKSCCVLLSGFVYRHKLARNGSRQILAIHFKGDLLGLNHELLSAADHSIQCLSRAEVAFIRHEDISAMAAEFPNIGRALWRETLVEASVVREWIVNVGQRNARERIAHLLCELALRQDIEADPASRSIDWPLTQEQLGDATGLTAVHVNRTVQGMRAAGLISTDRHSVTILDWAALQHAGAFNRTYLHLPDANQRLSPVIASSR